MKITVIVNTESDALWGDSTSEELAAFDIPASEAEFIRRVQARLQSAYHDDTVIVDGQEFKNDITIETGEGWEADRREEEAQGDCINELIYDIHAAWNWTIDKAMGAA